MANDQEFGWLLSDVEEYNLNKDKKKISLLESDRRAELDEDEAKSKARKAARESNGPLVEEDAALADAGEPIEAGIDDEADEDAADEEDERPDLLLRESARIVADMIVLSKDQLALDRQFTQLHKDTVSKGLN